MAIATVTTVRRLQPVTVERVTLELTLAEAQVIFDVGFFVVTGGHDGRRPLFDGITDALRPHIIVPQQLPADLRGAEIRFHAAAVAQKVAPPPGDADPGSSTRRFA